MDERGERIWFCKIGGMIGELSHGSDLPMRRAVQAAFEAVTGCESQFTFSGWAGSLTEGERAVVECRRPVPTSDPSGVDVEAVIRELQVPLFDAVNEYAAACRNNEATTSVRRQRAVVAINDALRAALSAATKDASPKNTDAQR